MPYVEWTTNTPAAQDTDPNADTEQPDLADDPLSVPRAPGTGDNTRVSQIMTMRNKLHSLYKKVGDNGALPAGCLLDILDGVSGDAKFLRLTERALKPANIANVGFLYVKDVGGNTELYYEDESGNEEKLSDPENRFLIFADDTQFTEGGAAPVIKKTFRVVNDSDSPVSFYRLVVTLWCTNAGATATCTFDVGGNTDTVTSTVNPNETDGAIVAVDVPSPGNDQRLTVNIKLHRSAGAGNVHLKYTDVYAVY